MNAATPLGAWGRSVMSLDEQDARKQRKLLASTQDELDQALHATEALRLKYESKETEKTQASGATANKLKAAQLELENVRSELSAAKSKEVEDMQTLAGAKTTAAAQALEVEQLQQELAREQGNVSRLSPQITNCNSAPVFHDGAENLD